MSILRTVDLGSGGQAELWADKSVVIMDHDKDRVLLHPDQIRKLAAELPPAPATPNQPPIDRTVSLDWSGCRVKLGPASLSIDPQSMTYAEFDQLAAWINTNRPFVEVK